MGNGKISCIFAGINPFWIVMTRNIMKLTERICICSCMLLALMSTNVQAQEVQQWWGYWTSPMGLQEVGELAPGNNVMGIRLTAKNTVAVGTKLHGIRFYISDKTSVTAAKVWASSRQSAGYNLLNAEVPASELKDVNNDGEPTVVMLDEPIDLLQSGNAYANMYIGFCITMPDTGTFTPCQMMASGESTNAANANLYDWKSVENTCGPIAMQLLISNPDLPETGATALIPEGLIVVKDEPYTVDIPIRNDGMEGLQKITYQWTIDETAAWEMEYEFPQPVTELEATPTLPVTITCHEDATWHELGLTILSINGKDVGGKAEGKPILVVDQLGTKRTVMEEFTGTWCPNCPRGTVGMELLEEAFGERFIGIAVHNDDPMTIAAYDGSQFRRSVTSALGGFPAATVDRFYKCDPYMGYTLQMHFQTDAIVEQALSQKAVADVYVTAQWADDAPGSIDCDVATTFYYSDPEAHHALVVVATADGLSGETQKWLQCNEFMDRTWYDPDMDEYVYGERWMKVDYNHVAVAVEGVENGISGSIASPLASLETQHFSQRLTIPATLLQSGARYHVVAMLVNTETGQVVNAAKSAPLTIATGIASPGSESVLQGTEAAGCYTLQGIKIEERALRSPGIYIVGKRKVAISR